MKKYTYKKFTYYRFRRSPELLILSGTHGDENIITRTILRNLQQFQSKLPAFLFIPAVSPSAVMLSTRRNYQGLDINRSYINSSIHEEITTGMDIIRRYSYRLCMDFHMDRDQDAFYMYDSMKMKSSLLRRTRKNIIKCNVPLFNGIDDPYDRDLGNKISGGYLVDRKGTPGSVWDWVLQERLANRIITVEIPLRQSHRKMGCIINTLFGELIVPLAGNYNCPHTDG